MKRLVSSILIIIFLLSSIGSALVYAPVIALSPITQTFGIGSGTFSSNRNYFIEKNGTLLANPSTSMIIDASLLGTDSIVGSNAWSLQMNAYNPNGVRPALTQYVIGYSRGSIYAQIYLVAANDCHKGCFPDVFIFGTVNQSQVVAGTKFSIDLQTNSTGNVVLVTFTIASASAKVLWIGILVPPIGDRAGIVGWELNLIGYGSASTATFTQASGSFFYSSDTSIGFTTAFPGDLSYVQYKGTGTAEKSNLAYALPVNPNISTTTSTTLPPITAYTYTGVCPDFSYNYGTLIFNNGCAFATQTGTVTITRTLAVSTTITTSMVTSTTVSSGSGVVCTSQTTGNPSNKFSVGQLVHYVGNNPSVSTTSFTIQNIYCGNQYKIYGAPYSGNGWSYWSGSAYFAEDMLAAG